MQKMSGILLVDDGIDAEGGLADLAVADDQLPLAAADGGHGIDGLEARVHGLLHALARDDARGHHFDASEFFGIDRALAVDRLAHGIDDHRPRTASPTGTSAMRPVRLTMSPSLMWMSSPRTATPTLSFFQVQGEPEDPAGELQQFHGHDFFKP